MILDKASQDKKIPAMDIEEEIAGVLDLISSPMQSSIHVSKICIVFISFILFYVYVFYIHESIALDS